MKKVIIYLITVLIFSNQSFSQKSEYRYLALKFGVSHGLSPAPTLNPNKYLNTPVGEMQLNPVGSAYVPGFVFDFLYHFDFNSDNGGIFTGIEYNYGGVGAKYETTYDRDFYTMNETFRYHSVGMPLAFKFGPDLWNTQRYVYAGVQANMMLAMSSVQKVNWNESSSSETLPSNAFNRVAFNLFLGFNYAAFNIQFDYYPKSLFNTMYVSESGFKPYFGQAEKVFNIKTTINLPYGWLSQQSFWWRKVLRNTPWR